MLTTALQGMEKASRATFEETGAAQALWFGEWARLVLKAYEPESKVVYVSAYAFPMEILAAFDVVPFDFELTSGLAGALNEATPKMEEAEGRGFSLDVCSFHRTALGAAYLDAFPEPDILVTASYYCDGKAKTNEILGALHGRKALLLQVPAAVSQDSVQYVEKQLREIAAHIGEAVGQRLDEERLKEAVRTSNRARQSQLAMLELLKHRPAPWGGSDLIAFSINSLMFAGTQMKETLNDAFRAELEQRIQRADLPPERFRIYWFAWMPTYRSNLFDLLRENGISVPLCENFRIHSEELDESNPFESLALRCLTDPFVGAGSRRTEGLDRITEDYALDGALLFATPACRHANTAYPLLKDALAELGLPFLVFDMDIGDPRDYSPRHTLARLEAFVELLEQRVS
jgi:benzoyl-CoA reductase/2-hydroxyglutaryl-CoA dehydratase subunit BcrC/BadD/HgdB